MAATSIMIGSAATLGGVAASGLGAGSATVARCDANGFTVSYHVENGSVETVTVSDIADPGCEGGRLSVTLAGSGGGSVGVSAVTTIPADGDTSPNSVTVAVSPKPVATTVAKVHVSVVGP